MVQNTLEVKNLVKKYNHFVAVDNLSFSIKKGEIYALLGPNGAGKTSTFETIENLISKTSGIININGTKHEMRNNLNKDIGIQLQNSSFQESMKIKEIINLVCKYYGCQVNKTLFESLKICDIADKKISQLSVGQKRKVTLYLAIMHEPKLIILDEPTAGLDVISKNQIYCILNEFKEKGCSILISSHDMREIEKLADRIGVIVNGKLLKEGSTLEITNNSNESKKIILKTKKGTSCYINNLKKYSTKIDELDQGYTIIYTKSLQQAISYIIKAIETNEDMIDDLRIVQPSLEEIFMKITKNKN